MPMTDQRSAQARVIAAGWHGLKGDPETHDGGSVDGYLAAAREGLIIAKERMRSAFAKPERDILDTLLAELTKETDE